MEFILPQQDKSMIERYLPLRLISIIVILWMIVPILLFDFWVIVYHAVYFRICGIPLIPRGQYISMDRARLKRLTWVQRMNCAYCDYANGAIAWIKAVINTTEVYSCAIKHGSTEYYESHQEGYYDYADLR